MAQGERVKSKQHVRHMSWKATIQ